MRVTFYTVNIGRYDYMFPRPAHGAAPAGCNVRWVFISDKRPAFLRGWSWQALPEAAGNGSATERNRYCKFFPHKVFPEIDISVYLDANVVLIRDIMALLEEFLASRATIGLGYVDKRHTIQEEGRFIARSKRFDATTASVVARQIERYEDLGLPGTHRLMQGRVIFRRHTDPDLAPAMQTWWDEFAAYSKRDQISLPYVLYAHGLKVKAWDWSAETGEVLFDVARHRPPRAALRPGAYIEAMRSSGTFWSLLYRIYSPIYVLRAHMHKLLTRVRRMRRKRTNG